MPTWAYIYCGLIIVSGLFSVFCNRSKASYYIPGELLSVVIAISFFLIYYHVISRPTNVFIPILMIAYMVYWELWENKHQYLSPEQSADVQEPPLSFMIVFSLVFISPLLLIILKVIGSYFE